MIRKLSFLIGCLLLLAGAIRAQDALNLPTELYVLTTGGLVQRYGVGASGISSVTPDSEFVLDFGVAPDGNWLAYRTETALNLLNMATGDTSLIEANAGVPSARGRGDTLAWSPKGDAIAYTTLYGGRVYFSGSGSPVFLDLRESVFVSLEWSPDGSYLAAQAEPNIWWLYRRDGMKLILSAAIPSSAGLAWLSGSELVFAPDEGGLIRMNLAQANAQAMLLDATQAYALPELMPDGTLAVFARQKADENALAENGLLTSLKLDTLKVETVGQGMVELTDLRWAPGGQFAVAFRGGVVALVLPTSGEGFTLPISGGAAYSWGPPPLESVSGIKLPANAYFLTQDTNGIMQVWRLKKDGSTAEPVTRAEADISEYTLSSNERNIAYTSGQKVWLQPLTGTAHAKALADTGKNEVRNITFSPDGTHIAFDTLSGAESPEGGIWLVSADGGDATLILPNGPADAATPVYQPPFYGEPQFAPNVNALLAAVHDTETVNFAIYDLNSQATLDVGKFDQVIWLTNGRIAAFGNGIGLGDPPPTQDISTVNPADLTHTQLASIPYPARILGWREIGNNVVRLIEGSYLSGPQLLSVFDVETESGALTPVGSGGFITAPLLSPDGTFIAGQTHAGGPLTFLNLQNGKQVVIGDPASVSNFQWGK